MEHNYFIEFTDGSYLTARVIENKGEFVDASIDGRTVTISRDEIDRIDTVAEREWDGDRERIVLNTGEEITDTLGTRGMAREYAQ